MPTVNIFYEPELTQRNVLGVFGLEVMYLLYRVLLKNKTYLT